MFALVIASCGGGEDAASASTSAATTSPSRDDGGDAGAPSSSTTEAADDGDQQADGGSHAATVTIGNDTWEFIGNGFPAETCNSNFFGGFLAVLFMADQNGEILMDGGKASGFNLVLPGPTWAADGIDDPPAIGVSISGADVEWVADPETLLPGVEPGQSQVDSWSLDGNRASGTATFIETNAAYGGTVEPITGTFEIACAG